MSDATSLSPDQLYRRIVETAHQGIWVIGLDGRTLYANPRVAAMLGYAPDEMQRVNVFDCMPPEQHAGFRERMVRRVRGDTQTLEWEALRKDGSRLSTLVSSSPLLGDDGQAIGVLGMITDVTEQTRVRAALAESEERYRLAIERSPDLIFHQDPDLRFTWFPKTIPPFQESDLLGKTDADILPPAEADPILALKRRVLATGVAERLENAMEFDGVLYDFETVLVRRTDTAGHVLGIAGYCRDVTERKRAERALEEANRTLEARIAERTESLRESERHFRALAERNRLLAQEVEHRVGNNLAALLALVSLMRGRTRDVDAFAGAIEARLRAMSQVHRMLVGSGWRSVGLRELVTTVLGSLGRLAPHPADERVTGPADAPVSPEQALPLMLILAEWFTNSCKYGAHSVPGGRLEVGWDVSGENGDGRRVRLTWTERGGPPVHAPVAPSLGTELVKAFCMNELRGTCAMHFTPDGAEHAIEFAVEQAVGGRQ